MPLAIHTAQAPGESAAAMRESGESTASRTWTTILGRPDQPTDGVRDYCEFLGRALERPGINLEIARVDWMQKGWLGALRELRSGSERYRGKWAILQYTAFAWSRRGFPLGALAVLAILRRRGARCAVVFHEPFRQGGARWIDRLRGACQSWVIRRLYHGAEKSVFPEPIENIAWLPQGESKAAFIPIGANIPDRAGHAPADAAERNGSAKTVAVFCVTGAPHDRAEIEDIAEAARVSVADGARVRFVFFGRGTPEANEQITRAFRGISAEVSVLGLLDAGEISNVLATSDVLLCVRGPIQSRRGSAIAGIAAGLPIVGYRGPETRFPFTEAGLELAPYRDRAALAKTLRRVLADDRLREELRKKSLRAHAEYFSWQKIAERFLAELPAGERPYRVLIVATHPIQYAAPQFRRFAADPRLDIQVAYCSLLGAEAQLDQDFGVEVKWDVPLLEGYPWTCLPNRLGEPRLGSFLGLFNPGIWRLIRTGNFDAVILYTGYVYATFWMAIAAAKASGIAVLFGTDATGFQPRDRRRWKTPIKKRVLPRVFRLADVVVAPSEAGREFMLGMGISESCIVLTPFVVDSAWWEQRAHKVDRRAIRREWNIPEDAAVILFCAKLQPWKRPSDVLRAFADADVEGAYLVFAGEGTLRRSLENEAKSLGVSERTRFLGFVNQTGLPSVYRSSDLLVMPSEYDPCPVVVCEAMLCGCPVALSDQIRGRFDLVRHGITGFIYPCGDVEALSKILSSALSDPNRLKRLGRAAAERMETWSMNENVDATVRAVRQACDS